ncbi:hypothetical protein BC833DRAFT_600484 [Globomyces pollinis-pini]|nr:hypothetical protein BC833DRAFT_600484 [Globomyces pollinis-pini]
MPSRRFSRPISTNYQPPAAKPYNQQLSGIQEQSNGARQSYNPFDDYMDDFPTEERPVKAANQPMGMNSMMQELNNMGINGPREEDPFSQPTERIIAPSSSRNNYPMENGMTKQPSRELFGNPEPIYANDRQQYRDASREGSMKSAGSNNSIRDKGRDDMRPYGKKSPNNQAYDNKGKQSDLGYPTTGLNDTIGRNNIPFEEPFDRSAPNSPFDNRGKNSNPPSPYNDRVRNEEPRSAPHSPYDGQNKIPSARNNNEFYEDPRGPNSPRVRGMKSADVFQKPNDDYNRSPGGSNYVRGKASLDAFNRSPQAERKRTGDGRNLQKLDERPGIDERVKYQDPGMERHDTRNQRQEPPMERNDSRKQRSEQPIERHDSRNQIPEQSMERHDSRNQRFQDPLERQPSFNQRPDGQLVRQDSQNAINQENNLSRQNSRNDQLICNDCQRPIYDLNDAFEIDALESWFHINCFRCLVCKRLFGDDFPYVPHEGKAYCEQHYQELFLSNCAACGEPITDGKISHAFGRVFHSRHLRCTICKHRIRGPHVEHNGKAFCAEDYEKLTASSCAKCKNAIDGNSVHACGSVYHRQCFGCTTCSAPFPDKKFFVYKKLPYCFIHYHEANNTLCGSCKEPIEGPCVDVRELRKRYHPNCWKCGTCNIQLTGVYYSFNGKAYCENDIDLVYNQAPISSKQKGKPNKRNTLMTG